MVTIEWTADVEGQNKAFEAGEYLNMVGNWSNARIEPFGPLSLSPAAAVLHYAQEIFEVSKPTATMMAPSGRSAHIRMQRA